MSKSIFVPALPNSPLMSKSDEALHGEIHLRFNPELDFIENYAFDPKKAAYDNNYQNSQAHSDIFNAHMKGMFGIIKKYIPKGGLVVEVGCGKGDFVELMESDSSFSVIGYDATYDGDNPLIEKRYLSFNDKIDADFVILRHVLEHIQNPHAFLVLMQHVFGHVKIYIEVPNYSWIIENQAFYDITYEHVNYFTPYSLAYLFDHQIHNSGLCFNNQYQFLIADLQLLSNTYQEQYLSNQWIDIDFYKTFHMLSEKILHIEKKIIESNKIYIWGASTKGCMFLVHCLDRSKIIDNIGFAIDINPKKWGKYLPGSHVPIKSKDEFFHTVREEDILVIANPNYKDEIIFELTSQKINNLIIITL
ncbi:class I SAM-dependent methyltransferase [Aeromonas hydrophila]|uniref:class I SAM-dependent methyltransferase n=1 Tax=Aeromonas hydrophila TaxID=644 RepID=UPI003CF0F3B1